LRAAVTPRQPGDIKQKVPGHESKFQEAAEPAR